MAQTKTPMSFSSTIAEPEGNINTQLAHKTLRQKISEYGVRLWPNTKLLTLHQRLVTLHSFQQLAAKPPEQQRQLMKRPTETPLMTSQTSRHHNITNTTMLKHQNSTVMRSVHQLSFATYSKTFADNNSQQLSAVMLQPRKQFPWRPTRKSNRKLQPHFTEAESHDPQSHDPQSHDPESHDPGHQPASHLLHDPAQCCHPVATYMTFRPVCVCVDTQWLLSYLHVTQEVNQQAGRMLSL